MENVGIKKVMMDDAPMADVMKLVVTWDSGNSASFNAITHDPLMPLMPLIPLMGSHCRGIDIGPDLTDKEISKEESNLGGETHQAVKDDGLYIFKGEPSDSKIMGYKERDGRGSSNMGGLGTKLSADSSKRLLVRKIRSAEIRKFGGKFTNVLGKRSGDSRIVGEVYVLKKRKVIAKKGVITGVNQGHIQGEGLIQTVDKEEEECVENQTTSFVTQVRVSAIEDPEKLSAG
ncbi:hypothetical protein QYF36_024705 [Acer negundo]|nr:hypothetical protein QYF36_024705 [Acer negundo]